jgi:hypothetical protein
MGSHQTLYSAVQGGAPEICIGEINQLIAVSAENRFQRKQAQTPLPAKGIFGGIESS